VKQIRLWRQRTSGFIYTPEFVFLEPSAVRNMRRRRLSLAESSAGGVRREAYLAGWGIPALGARTNTRWPTIRREEGRKE
jgi:hypothetical protein